MDNVTIFGQENQRQQELTQQRQRANATRKESHKLSSSDKGKEKVIYAKKKQATLVQPLRERNVGVQIREVCDMNVTGVREENERAKTLARDNQGSSSTAKGKGKENARVTDSNMVSKATLAQRARRERERNLKQGSAYQLGQRSEVDQTIESFQLRPYTDPPSLTPSRRRLDCMGQGTNVTQPAEKRQTTSHTTSTCSFSIPSTSSTPERNWHTLSGQMDLCCDDELDMATSLEAPTRAHISLGRHYLGNMDILCPRCSTLHWMNERLARSSRSRPLFGTCCLQGKIKLHALITPPPPLKALFDGDDDRSKSFRMYVRVYNTTNAFTSLGATFDERVLPGRGPTPFTIHGELRHRVGSLLPQQGNDASYAQLYIYDPASALEVRNRRNQQLRRDVLQTIQDTLLQVNPFVEKFRQAHAILGQLDQAGQTLPAHLHYCSLKDCRVYNLPTVDEIAVVIPGDGSKASGMRDIILHLRGDNQLMQINECHPAYLPLHYVLLFPHGELGWEPEMKQWDVKNNQPAAERIYVTCQIQFWLYFMGCSSYLVKFIAAEKCLGEMHARIWWEENQARIQEQYL